MAKEQKDMNVEVTQFDHHGHSINGLFEFSPASVFLMDQSGEILDANEAFAVHMGINRQECLGANIYDMLPPNLAALRRKKAEATLRTGALLSFDDEHNGKILRHTIYPSRSPEGEVNRLLFIAEDITDFTSSELDLRYEQVFNKALIDATPGIFCVLKANGRLAAWNPYLRDAIVCKSDQEMGSIIAIEYIHQDDRSLVQETISRVLSNNIEESAEVRVLLGGGPEFRWILLTGKQMVNKGSHFIIVIGSDITDRKKAEQALRESERKFRSITEQMIEMVFVTDSSGYVTYVSPTIETVTGYKPDEVIGHLFTEYMEEGDISRAVAIFTDAISRHLMNQVLEFQYRKKNGSLFHAEIHSQYFNDNGFSGVIGLLRDVSERKLAETQLLKLSTAIEQSPAVVVITDLFSNVEYVNPMFTLLTGYSAEEVKGKNPRILQSGRMPKTLYKELWKTILSGDIWRGEFQNRKKNGELFWETAVISAILNKKGEITNFVAAKEDITEQKKYYDDLIVAKEKAEEGDRLKSAFLANISHEIRTPMNGILGFSELLKEPDLSGEEQTKFIDLIQQSGKRLMNLINDLIDISRIESGDTQVHISETSVNQLLHDITHIFKPEADKKELRFSCSPGLPDHESIIGTDSSKVKKILTNLIQNALKFTSSGDIKVGYTKKGDILEFYVTDTGIGIAVDMKTKIFERFRQANNTLTRHHEGAGLGLSIALAYVTMLGDTIRVESEVGTGSTFFFSLPYNPPPPLVIPSAAKDPSHPILSPHSALCILIAEDDAVCRLVLEMHLKADNITILYAVNGQEAVEVVRCHPEINLVFMDIKMPVMNGFDATRHIKEFRPKLPVIAQTAFTSFEEREKARQAGCNGFITKPINKSELLALMHDVLRVGNA